MLISNYLIKHFLHRVKQLNIYSKDDIYEIQYSLQSILYEIEKILLLFIIYLLLNQVDYFLITLIVFLSIRINAGGYHSTSSLWCTIYTFIAFAMAINIMPNFNIPLTIKFLCAGFSILISLMLAPMISEQKKEIYSNNIITKKIMILFITILWLGIFLYLNNLYTVPVLGIITLQNSQLLFEYLRRRGIRHEINKI